MSKLSKYLNDEIREIEKYNRKTNGDNTLEWVKKYAKNFRKEWEQKFGKVVESGVYNQIC